MTRKDYILLSNCLREHYRPKISEKDFMIVEWEKRKHNEICTAIGFALENDNPAFDMKLWLKECGL